MEKKRLEPLRNATVDFYSYTLEGIDYFEFDTSMCTPPEPMINAMLGLKLLKRADQRLVMINMHEPQGLYSKIASDYTWEVETLDNDDVKITFRRIEHTRSPSTDFDDTACSGV